MDNAFGRLWRWFLDRMSERSTKSNVFSLLGILATFGLLSWSFVDALQVLVEQGQADYESVYALIIASITNVKAIIGYITAFIAAVSNVFGALSQDAKRGKTYDQIMAENQLNPEKAYAASIGTPDTPSSRIASSLKT